MNKPFDPVQEGGIRLRSSALPGPRLKFPALELSYMWS